jgi:hypothetical protein
MRLEIYVPKEQGSVEPVLEGTVTLDANGAAVVPEQLRWLQSIQLLPDQTDGVAFIKRVNQAIGNHGIACWAKLVSE